MTDTCWSTPNQPRNAKAASPGFWVIINKQSKTPSALAISGAVVVAIQVALVLKRHKEKSLQVLQNAICSMLLF